MPDVGFGSAGCPPSGLRAQLHGLTDTWRAMTEARLGIFAIEARRSVSALVRTVVCAALAACVLIASWLLAVAGAVWWAVERGASPGIAIIVALVVNLALAFVAIYGARTAMKRIDFAHTQRALRAPGLPP
ncbi:MAG: hypothetical protein IT493_01735 [Gammaproteobacteria bacterium]|nr:hypothetical protein [Gammaproteobacteria bacterium]